MLRHDAPLTSLEAVRAWIEAVRAADRTRVTATSLSRSSAWALVDGALRHRTRRYFNIVGLEWVAEGAPRCQPFIEQREIGTLGFIARRRGGELELLVHAKAEPGNIGVVQLAPTCQATASNQDRVHDGDVPPFSGYFGAVTGDILSDTRQSEQGSRFLGKRNRNVFVVDDLDTGGFLHRWISLELFKTLLAVDFLVNTDARSVLCCTDWRTLSGGAGRDGFGGALWRSLDSEPRPSLLRETQVRLDRLKQRAPTPMRRPVEHLDGWGFDAEGPVIMANGELALRQIEVHCATREAPHWDQPILQTLQEQIVELLCRNLDGTLEFAFRPYWEPGLVSGAELGPSFFRCPAGPTTPGIIRARVRQSDEGGRFYHTTAEYRIVEVAAGAGDGGLLWHRLSEVQATIGTAIFNNEARSALSVLLACL